ncbi:MAG: DUF3306 domain-containing protein [Sulfitobacter sp.]
MSGFWGKRRAGVQAEAKAEALAAEQIAQAEVEAALEERSDEDLLAEFELPAPEDLVSGEQLRAFLKAQLPQRLKTRALRSFWRSNPVLACLDGLNDYDDDYTLAATAGKPVNTLYQVGKGILAAVQEAEPQQEAAPQQEVEPEDAAPEVLPEPLPVAAAQTLPETEPDMAPEPQAPEQEAAPTFRRMRFAFAAAPDAESTA